MPTTTPATHPLTSLAAVPLADRQASRRRDLLRTWDAAVHGFRRELDAEGGMAAFLSSVSIERHWLQVSGLASPFAVALGYEPHLGGDR